jgi:hypothetical protein
VWLSFFRLTYETFHLLEQQLKHLLQRGHAPNLPEAICPGEQLGLCLYFMAHGSGYPVRANAAWQRC